MTRTLLLTILLAPLLCAEDPMPAEDVINDHIDIVIHGTLKVIPDVKMTVQLSANGKTHEKKDYLRVEIHPWHYLPDFSSRFVHLETYSAYISAERLSHTPPDYESTPQFWGLRKAELFQFTVERLNLTPQDTGLQRAKAELDDRYKDVSAIRPLSLKPIKGDLSLKVEWEEGKPFLRIHNDSTYAVWCKKIGEKPLRLVNDSYTYGIDGRRQDGVWIWYAGGRTLRRPDRNRFAIPEEIEPKTTFKFPISLSTMFRPSQYNAFRAHVQLYPSSDLFNGYSLTSAEFGVPPNEAEQGEEADAGNAGQ